MLKYIELKFCLLFCMGLKLGVSYLAEYQRLSLCEDRVVRKVSGPKKQKLSGIWRRSHGEKLYDFYS